MPSPRDDIEQLFRQGSARIDEVAASVAELFASGNITTEPIPGASASIVRITQQPDRSLAFLTMDAVHYVRCGLDQLAWQLVLAGGGKPSRDTSFPIRENATGFGPVLKKSLFGASQEHRDAVRALKPWRHSPADGQGDMRFPNLQALDNAYKHRFMVPAVMSTPIFGSTHFTGVGESLSWAVHVPGDRTIEDGAEVDPGEPIRFSGEFAGSGSNPYVPVTAGYYVEEIDFTLTLDMIVEAVHGIPLAVGTLMADI